MKKRLIPIIAYATMSLTGLSQSSWKMNEAVNTLADMEEWMNVDMAKGHIDEELGQEYLDNINRVLKLLLTSNTNDACVRDKDLHLAGLTDPSYFERKEKREFTLIKFVIASNDTTAN